LDYTHTFCPTRPTRYLYGFTPLCLWLVTGLVVHLVATRYPYGYLPAFGLPLCPWLDVGWFPTPFVPWTQLVVAGPCPHTHPWVTPHIYPTFGSHTCLQDLHHITTHTHVALAICNPLLPTLQLVAVSITRYTHLVGGCLYIHTHTHTVGFPLVTYTPHTHTHTHRLHPWIWVTFGWFGLHTFILDLHTTLRGCPHHTHTLRYTPLVAVYFVGCGCYPVGLPTPLGWIYSSHYMGWLFGLPHTVLPFGSHTLHTHICPFPPSLGLRIYVGWLDCPWLVGCALWLHTRTPYPLVVWLLLRCPLPWIGLYS